MRAVKAKKLRRLVYQDTSHKIKRVYIIGDGMIRNHPQSPRAVYQAVKKGE